MEHLDLLFLEFYDTEIKLLIIFVCDYFVMILYEFIFIFIQEKEAEKLDQAMVARRVAQAEDVSVFLLHTTVTDHRTLLNLQHSAFMSLLLFCYGD